MLTKLQWETESWSSFSEQVAWRVEEQSVKKAGLAGWRGQVAGQIWNRAQAAIGAPVRGQIQNTLRSPI